jgi:hypothetical protein
MFRVLFALQTIIPFPTRLKSTLGFCACTKPGAIFRLAEKSTFQDRFGYRHPVCSKPTIVDRQGIRNDTKNWNVDPKIDLYDAFYIDSVLKEIERLNQKQVRFAQEKN